MTEFLAKVENDPERKLERILFALLELRCCEDILSLAGEGSGIVRVYLETEGDHRAIRTEIAAVRIRPDPARTHIVPDPDAEWWDKHALQPTDEDLGKTT